MLVNKLSTSKETINLPWVEVLIISLTKEKVSCALYGMNETKREHRNLVANHVPKEVPREKCQSKRLWGKKREQTLGYEPCAFWGRHKFWQVRIQLDRFHH